MANIVYLDAYTLNPGDLDWGPLAALGNLTVYDRTTTHMEAKQRAAAADVLLVNKFVVEENMLDAMPRVRAVVVTATGCNNIDLAATKRRGIVVCNAVGYGAAAVAQHAFALILSLTNHVMDYHESVLSGQWSAQPDFCYLRKPLIGLAGKTLGIFGLGKIGSQIAAIAQGFGMSVIGFRAHPEKGAPVGVRLAEGKERVFLESDIVCLSSPLTPQTAHLVNEETLALMKPTALLINVARGELVDEVALLKALCERRLAGAGLDVLDGEPPRADHPLFQATNCLITPHVSWLTTESRQRLLEMTVENVRSILNGNPINVVG